MKKLIVAFAVTLALSLAAQTNFAQKKERGPSTEKERAQAVRLTRALENDPLNKDAQNARNWLFLWLAEVPDISVQICGEYFKQTMDKDKTFSAEIGQQMLFGMAAFIIENPDKAKDYKAAYQAGIESSLKVYETVLKEKPKAKTEYLDSLVEKKNKGELSKYIEEATAKDKCGEEKKKK